MTTFAVLLISVFVVGVSSYPNGPPISACTSLTPGHGASTNNKDPPPYHITVSSANYAPGGDITVAIEQTVIENEFRGFIIQARRTSGDMNTPIGTFKDLPAGTQLLGCTPTGSTWAHSAATAKPTVTATWTAPTSDQGAVAFRATIVVQNSGVPKTSIFYENIMSAGLTYAELTKCQTERTNATNGPLLGQFIPKCTFTGEYEMTQCHSTGYCWCVDENGVERNGTRLGRGQGQPICDTHLTECQGERAKATNGPIVGQFIPKCTETGEYERMQCHGSTGYCWCVDGNGVERNGTRVSPGQGQPNCDYGLGDGGGAGVLQASLLLTLVTLLLMSLVTRRL